MQKNLWLCFCMALSLMVLGVASSADAMTIFQEDFNTVSGTVYGVPTKSGTGADNDWYGARWGAGSGTIASDIFTRPPNSTLGVDMTYVAMQDDAGILIPVSTAGYENVSLSFDYRLYLPLSAQSLRVGYFLGEITGFGADRTADLITGDASWSNWTTLLTGKYKSTPWLSVTLSLPEDEEDLWIGFWYYSSTNNSRYPLLGNISVDGDALPIAPTAEPVPEPASMALLGIGLVGLAARKFRRKAR